METMTDDEPAGVIGGGAPQADFQRRLLACWRDIDTVVLGLAERYDLMVILRALAEYTGSGLITLMQRQTGGAPRAVYLIGRLEVRALSNGSREQHHEG